MFQKIETAQTADNAANDQPDGFTMRRARMPTAMNTNMYRIASADGPPKASPSAYWHKARNTNAVTKGIARFWKKSRSTQYADTWKITRLPAMNLM